MLGFMLVTWLLSMWISNTATAAMMVPVAMAVYEQMTTIEVSSSIMQTSTICRHPLYKKSIKRITFKI